MALGDKKGILLESGTNELEIIEVYIDEEGGYRGYYGINVAKVLEIINMPDKVITPPYASQFVTGVFNHRGKVIMILDLARWLRRKQAENGNRIIIITEFNNVTSAFLVSGVIRIHRTSWASIKPLDSYMQDLCEAVTGTILLDDKIVLMLDLERAMGDLDPRLAVTNSVLPEKQESLPDLKVVGLTFPLKVVHADDSQIIRRKVKQILESNQEFVVTSVTDGKEALQCLVELKKKAADEGKRVSDFVDIVLSDIEMPEMDGYHFCQNVKNDPDLRTLPFVLFSSLITDKLRHKGDSVGADAQFAKPISHELIYDLKEILSRQSVS